MYDAETVSIIIPIYNSGSRLAETLASALAQTYSNIEILLADDCSKDESRKIAQRHADDNANVFLFELEDNSGAGAARNRALEEASGRYVAFLDSDDLWYPDKLERQLAFMRDKNAAFSFTAIEMIDEMGNLIKPKREVHEVVDYRFLLRNTMIATSSVVIDRQFVGDVHMSTRRDGEDYETWLRILRNGTLAYGMNDALVQYRVCSNSLSSNKLRSIREVFTIQNKSEGIKWPLAAYNTLHFIWNATKKRIM